MIFSEKYQMYTKVLFGEKTLTTRLRLPAHIAAGKVWAIVPRRASAAWWFDERPNNPPIGQLNERPPIVCNSRDFLIRAGLPDNARTSYVANQTLFALGYTDARIRIEAFWETPLQNMIQLEAQQEGVADVTEYAILWNKINGALGHDWYKNELVWRIRFSLPPDVAEAVSRVGRTAIEAAAISQARAQGDE